MSNFGIRKKDIRHVSQYIFVDYSCWSKYWYVFCA